MTRETKDELLLIILFLGFRLLSASFEVVKVSERFPSPNAGVVEDLVLAVEPNATLFALPLSDETLISGSVFSESFDSFGFAVSCRPSVRHLNKLLEVVLVL